MKKRLYIAINFDLNTTSILKENVDCLKTISNARKYTSKPFFHLTLCFLGNTDVKVLPKIIEALNEIKFDHFIIQIEDVEMFRNDKRNVLYRKVKDSTELMTLQTHITEALMKYGIPFYNRNYIPHVTLAKDIEIDTFPKFKTTKFQCRQFDLMESCFKGDECYIQSLFSKNSIKQ